MAAALAPSPALAGQPAPSFKAISWRVFTGGPFALPPQPTSQSHRVKPNGTLTLCNMGRLETLTLNFRFRHMPAKAFDGHGHLIVYFKEIFSGPEGTSKPEGYAPPRRNDLNVSSGKDAALWSNVGAFPGHRSAFTPIPPGKYTFVMKQRSKTRMRVSITFKTTHTC